MTTPRERKRLNIRRRISSRRAYLARAVRDAHLVGQQTPQQKPTLAEILAPTRIDTAIGAAQQRGEW